MLAELLNRVYRHVDLGPGGTIVLEREGHPVGLDTAFRYCIVPMHHSVVGIIGSACVDPSECLSSPAVGQHYSSTLLGTRHFTAYRHSHPLDYIWNNQNFAQPGPIYVVTRSTHISFFPSLTITQEFTLHVSSNAWKRCKDITEAFNYYSCTYNETSRGLLGVQVLPATVTLANPLIDKAHPLNQDDVVLVMHHNGRVTIEREPADGNPFYPLEDLPAYSYWEALVRAVEKEAASAPTPFAPSPGPIIISDIDSNSDGEYDFAGDLSSLSQTEYAQIEVIEQAWTASQQAEYNEEQAIEQALTASLTQQ
ncbi:hypothetical protein BT96DRAFT_998223 [Gymnopus androsaceus JB14]|uniref:Uncharacterized protein n=1 Tax=Gymnopus androsaceus JB14 TaxID=1447944 RepID=A0A6A4HC37_9AGAR|nr:hypothetical protein BT96DRAFT_998223 [Gymnopus androsaceus JB14]